MRKVGGFRCSEECWRRVALGAGRDVNREGLVLSVRSA